MMPLWWLMNLSYTNLILMTYILIIHSINYFNIEISLMSMKKKNIKFKW
uniref:ATP synthase F0 subunit 8 n=1 Tax=Ceraphron sp. MM-2014 TaxID=1502696 RepID=A0A096XKU4_9HYME|nr:ATP synthase F0 subunit 8 [Ceraphron sp. MM-2014]